MAGRPGPDRTFEPGHGYSLEDWLELAADDVEATADELARAGPPRDVLEPDLAEAVEKLARRQREAPTPPRRPREPAAE